MRRLADKYDLCISGGSDFHGKAKPGLELATGYGKLFIPEEILDRIKERRNWLKEHPEQLKHTKILFTDLDGTLLDGEKKISDYTWNVLKDWTSAGHRLVLCSGRDINSVGSVKDYLKLDFPGVYLVGYNGGQIYDCEKQETLYKVALSIAQVKKIVETAKQLGVHCHTYTDTHIVSPKDSEQFRYYRRIIKTPVIYSEDVTAVMTEGACKCIAVELEDLGRLEQLRTTLLPWAEQEGVTMLYSNPNYLEFFPSVSGKGASVQKLCELLGIDLCFSVAAGDEQNDLSMIETAGMGIAMLNGSEEVKMAATVITMEDNNHDGLAKALADLI
ncbi:MAG: Cof-type HAD-IIB family hydrolase [Lachnospiraceae bacterium]|nr:Cof-type HAD-IIB family hydrolase [Lachnospiraceae bacterium]